MTARRVDLIADGIENPGNARALVDAARMFGSHCVFRCRGKATPAWPELLSNGGDIGETTGTDLATEYRPIVALDNVVGASSVYGFQMPPGPRPAMIVGNERRASLATSGSQPPRRSRFLLSHSGSTR